MHTLTNHLLLPSSRPGTRRRKTKMAWLLHSSLHARRTAKAALPSRALLAEWTTGSDAKEPWAGFEGTTEPRKTTAGSEGPARKSHKRQRPGVCVCLGHRKAGHSLYREWWQRWVGTQGRALECHSKELIKFQGSTVILCAKDSDTATLLPMGIMIN